VEYAQLLNDGSEIDMKLGEWYANQGLTAEKSVVFNLPAQRPNVTVPVIELFLK
jgi:hypothetical protein